MSTSVFECRDRSAVTQKPSGLGVTPLQGGRPAMFRWRALVLCVLVALLYGGVSSVPALAVAARAASYCDRNESPRFRGKLADLKEQVGREMGNPLECSHRDSGTSDTLQSTSTGLAYIR